VHLPFTWLVSQVGVFEAVGLRTLPCVSDFEAAIFFVKSNNLESQTWTVTPRVTQSLTTDGKLR